jgi:tetratricopeptide (TPR) repeat protein
MTKPSFFAPLFPLFLGAALLDILAAGRVQAAPSPAVQQIQADGIVSGVVDTLWKQTDVYWHQGDYPRNIAIDRIITEADPAFLEAYATGGWLMDSLGRTKDAEAYYTLGTRNNPHAAYAFWSLGFFYFNTPHDYPAAARAFRSAVQQPDANLNEWKMLAHSYEKAGEWDNAVSTWLQIRARYPQGLAVERLLAEAQQKRQQAMTDRKPAP